jgi:cardiolipin synthase
MRTSEQRLWITAAYFVPTHQEKSAIRQAARRGVDVQLLVPSQSDSKPALAVQRSTYSDLMAAGVKIYELDGMMLHTKSVVIDGVWTILGSSNFDHRSVLFNDELDAVVLGSAVSGDLERYFSADVAGARRITPEQWRKRPFVQRIRETFWRLATTYL